MTAIEVADGRVESVLTPSGRIQTENLLLCAGIWGPIIGRTAGVSIPLTPVQHPYARTAPLDGLEGETRKVVHPIVRYPERLAYLRQHRRCYGIGSYQHEPLLVDVENLPSPDDASGTPAVVPFEGKDFESAMRSAVELFPSLRQVELVDKINGLFSMTPDGSPLIGESAAVGGFWIAETVWITHAAGVGKTIAELMVEGTSDLDLRGLDPNRFALHSLTDPDIRDRIAKQYHAGFALHSLTDPDIRDRIAKQYHAVYEWPMS